MPEPKCWGSKDHTVGSQEENTFPEPQAKARHPLDFRLGLLRVQLCGQREQGPEGMAGPGWGDEDQAPLGVRGPGTWGMPLPDGFGLGRGEVTHCCLLRVPWEGLDVPWG